MQPRALGAPGVTGSPGHPSTTDASEAPRVRVILCDDHELVRIGLLGLLKSDPTIEVVAEARTASEVVDAAARLTPDVVVMDIRMPGGSGIDACRDIRAAREATRVVILTAFADADSLSSAIMAGASGYVLKQVRDNDLLGVIHRVNAGESLIDPRPTARAAGPSSREARQTRTEKGGDLKRLVALVVGGVGGSSPVHHRVSAGVRQCSRRRVMAVPGAIFRAAVTRDSRPSPLG